MQNYRIVAKPNLTNVLRGKIMSFSLQRINPDAPALEQIRASWLCYNHISFRTDDKYLGKVINGPQNSTQWNEVKWDIEGRHKIVCQIIYGNQKEYIEYIQNVINAKQSVSYSTNTAEESENPFIFYKNLTQQIDWILVQEKQQQLSAEDEQAYQNRMESLKLFKEKLKFLLDKVPADCRENFGQVHVKHISSIYGEREDMSLRVCYFYNDNEVHLIDWTSPVDRSFCGVYVGKGETKEDAIKQALECWDKDNRYPEGTIKGYAAVDKQFGIAKEVTFDDDNRIILGKEIIYGGIEINFDTDGKSDSDSLSDAFASLGFAAIVVAGVITLVAPVPGSRVVSGLIWSSIAASTTSAVINIADRHREGFGNWKDDSFDILTIVSNVFASGTIIASAKWSSKTLLLTNLSQKQAIKITLIGQISADSLQGILITEELAEAIYSVMNNKTLPADIKLSKISALIKRGIMDGILITISIHGSKKNLTALKNDPYHSKTTMSLEKIDRYISGEEHFPKPGIENSLSEVPSKIPSQKTESSPVPNRVENSNQVLPASPNTVSNIADEIPSLMPYTKDTQYNKTLSVQITYENGVEKTLSAIYPQKWELLSMENKAKAVPGEYFHRILDENLTKGQEFSSLNKDKGNITYTTDLNSGTRKSNTSETESKTTVSTNHASKKQGQKELEDELKVWRKDEKINITKRVALAQTRCEVEGIVSEANFYNLEVPYYKELKNGRVKLVEAIDATYYRFIDVGAYMKLLKESYLGSSSLYPNVTPAFAKMHPTTERLIREFISNNQQFRIIDGLPGMHAEVLSTNNVFQQLEAKGKNVDEYLDKIEVYTIRLTEYEQGKAFPACRHCSGILSKSKGIHIPTGRVDD
ncbi:hypothetical protein A9G28_12755 [Gilliamella sp. Fer1-1]|uniref:YwqJ-related putative deaminase n=1 Tax=Gilliamella sp. Fer1-1 TaxID=3120240 RepID=UPI00080DB2D6|nr:YwqJ-related putative deaminase [Gilliamella apicola]OCG45180.1 hypothetical protein A9G28_12755 [Gilliamella apicola]